MVKILEADKIEVDVITLEDGEEYIVFETLESENNKYLFLANEKDQDDVCIRKVILKENKEYLIKLDNDDEFDEVMALFHQKHKEKEGKNEE